MSACGNQHGTAMVAALSIAMILLPLGAFVVLQCRTDFMIERNLRGEIEAFYVAEAGLEHAVAEIHPGQSFEQVLVGPDQMVGTADDGKFPFVEGAPADFPRPPFRYDVRVTQTGEGFLLVVSQGSGLNGSAKVLEALVTRSPLPFAPAALYGESNVTNLDLGGAGFLVSGFDHRVTDSPIEATGTAAPLAALGTPRADAEQSLRERLSDAHAHQLLGSGGMPSIATTAPLDLQRYAAALAGSPQSVMLPGLVAGASCMGTPDTPQISIIDGDLQVAERLTGSGVLVIRGTFSVTGTVAFTGLVLAMGGVVFDSASDVTITGTFWHAASQDERLQLRGNGAIVYSSAALASLDRAFPGLLPHAAVVAGWQELL